MDPALVQHLNRRKHIADYFYVSSIALLIYEHALSLERERIHIWNSPWTYTKVLYLLSRYLSYVYSAAINQLGVNVSSGLCRAMIPATLWLIFLAMFLSEVIMCIRTWALWKCDFRLAFGLSVMMLSFFIVQCVILAKLNDSFVIEPAPFDGYRGCFITGAGGLLAYNYIIVLVIDAVLFALVAASALRAYQLGDAGKLTGVVHRDGIMFYVYLLVLSITNIVIINTLPGDLWEILGLTESILYSVFTSRIILNIREVAHPTSVSNDTELHTYRDDMSSLVFGGAPEFQSRCERGDSGDVEWSGSQSL